MSYLKEMAEQGYNPESIGAFHYTMLPYLAALAGIKHDDHIVDIGAAQGHCIIPLQKAGYRNISVVDIDTYNFELFENKFSFRCFKCDVESEVLPFQDEAIDWIINFHLIEHLKDENTFLTEMYRVLKPGGGGSFGNS